MKERPFELDEFLKEAAGDDPDALAAVVAMGCGLDPVAPSDGVKARLFASLDTAPSRFERFSDAVAGMLDLTVDAARRVLEVIDQPARWVEGPGPASSCWVQRGPSLAGAITGFVRVPAGADFPEHTHLGDEAVLVIQGRFVDLADGREVGPGELVRKPPGSTHAYTVSPGGPDLVYLTVAHVGIDIGGTVIAPDDRPPD